MANDSRDICTVIQFPNGRLAGGDRRGAEVVKATSAAFVSDAERIVLAEQYLQHGAPHLASDADIARAYEWFATAAACRLVELTSPRETMEFLTRLAAAALRTAVGEGPSAA